MNEDNNTPNTNLESEVALTPAAEPAAPGVAQDDAAGDPHFDLEPEESRQLHGPDEEDETATEIVIDQRHVVLVTPDEHLVGAEAMKGLIKDPNLYQHGDRLVEIIRTQHANDAAEGQPPVVTPLSASTVREKITRYNYLWRYVKSRDGWERVQVHPQDWLVKLIKNRRRWPDIRCLDSVTAYPIFRRDLTLHQTPGYDPATRIVYEPFEQIPVVNPSPTQQDAVDAVALLYDLIDEFPFVGRIDVASYLAGLLTRFARPAYSGPTPGLIIEGNGGGIGKTKLADLMDSIASGRIPPHVGYSHDDAEMRKLISTLLDELTTLAVLDDAEGTIGNSALRRAATTEWWLDRRLGTNEMILRKMTVQFVITANNPLVGSEMSRRLLRCRLEYLQENPESRRGFKYPNLHATARANRPAYVHAALTIFAAYFAAGCPEQDVVPFGSFEGWSRVVRDALVFAGLPDPVRTDGAVGENANPERVAIAAIIAGLERLDPVRRGILVSAIAAAIQQPEYADMRVAFNELGGVKFNQNPAASIGQVLSRVRRHVVDGKFIDRAPKKTNAGVLWRVVLASDPDDEAGKAHRNATPNASEKSEGNGGGPGGGGYGGVPAAPSSVSHDGPTVPVASRVSATGSPTQSDGGDGGDGDSCRPEAVPPPAAPRARDAGRPPAGEIVCEEMITTRREYLVEYRYLTERHDAVAALHDIAQRIRRLGHVVGLDLETTGLDPLTALPRLIQIAEPEHETLVVDLARIGGLDAVREPLSQLVTVAHNAMFDLRFMLQHGRVHPRRLDCTMIADHVLTGQRHSLEDLALNRLKLSVDKTLQASDWSAGDLSEAQVAYAAKDAHLTRLLHGVLASEIDAHGSRRAYELAVGAQVAVANMMLRGVAFDRDAHAALTTDLQLRHAGLSAALAASLPGFNVSSGPQLGRWIANALGGLGAPAWHRWPKTKSGALSTSADVINACRNLLPVEAQTLLIEQIMPLRELTRSLSLYGSGFLEHVHQVTGRIHGHFNIAGAPTGRMSSSSPNLQAIPRDPLFRGLFAAPQGRRLVDSDFQQMELRVMAQLAGEGNLLQAFRDGVDVHRHTAAVVLGKHADSVTPDQRQLAKAMNFGLIFGQGAEGFQQYAAGNYGVHLTLEQATAHRTAWFQLYPGIADYHRTIAERLYREGYVVTPSGRRCRSADGRVTVAYNAPTQGGAAEIMLATLARLDAALTESGLDAALVLVVHDEVLVEAAEQDAEAARQIVQQAMIEGMAAVMGGTPHEGVAEAKICSSWAGK